MHQRDKPVDYYVWDAILKCYLRYMTKMTNVADLKTVLLTI